MEKPQEKHKLVAMMQVRMAQKTLLITTERVHLRLLLSLPLLAEEEEADLKEAAGLDGKKSMFPLVKSGRCLIKFQENLRY